MKSKQPVSVLGALVGAIALLALSTFVASTNASPAPRVTPLLEHGRTASSARFTSKRYRYSIALPAGWIARPASTTYAWAGNFTAQNGPEVDAFVDHHSHLFVVA